MWKSSVKASLHIQWPKWNKDGKWLLYLVKVTSTGQQDISCSPESEISPLKHIQVMLLNPSSKQTRCASFDCESMRRTVLSGVLCIQNQT